MTPRTERWPSVAIRDVKVGDVLLTTDGRRSEVTGKRTLDYPDDREVYALTVGGRPSGVAHNADDRVVMAPRVAEACEEPTYAGRICTTCGTDRFWHATQP